VLDAIQKGVKVQNIRDAMKMTHDSGWERLAYFIFGLPTDNEESMQDTIDIALETEPEFAKATISTPFPGTVLYEQIKEQGNLLSEEWGKFMMHNPRELYRHDTSDWDTIYRYYQKFYKDFYFRPSYMFRRLKYSLSNGTFFAEMNAFLSTDWKNT